LKIDSTSEIFLWTSIEANTIIIAACIPTIAPLVDQLFGRRMLGSTGRSARSSGKESSSAVAAINFGKNKTGPHQHRLYPGYGGSQGDELWTITTQTRNGDGDEDYSAFHMHAKDCSIVSTGIPHSHEESNDEDHEERTGGRTGGRGMEFDTESVALKPLNNTQTNSMDPSDIERERRSSSLSPLPSARRRSADPTRTSTIPASSSIWKRLSLTK
jgi:hypothetical protein